MLTGGGGAGSLAVPKMIPVAGSGGVLHEVQVVVNSDFRGPDGSAVYNILGSGARVEKGSSGSF